MSFIIGKETVYKIVDIIYLIIVVFVILGVVSLHINREVKVGNVEANTLIKRALYSSDCFAYKDVRDRPLVIDLSKFNNKTINNCIQIEKFSSRFRLLMQDKTIEAMNNENRFAIDKKLCNFRGYNCLEIKKPVLVYDNGLKRGVMQIDATIQES